MMNEFLDGIVDVLVVGGCIVSAVCFVYGIYVFYSCIAQ